MSQIYFSIDIETDGNAPGINSMLSLGCVAIDEDGNQISAFYSNLKPLPDATTNPETMEFWAKNPEAYAEATRNPQDPAAVMRGFVEWVNFISQGGKKPIAACWPTWDFMFVYWYLIKFVGSSPFGHRALCIKTLASAVLGFEFRNTNKEGVPKSWANGVEHTHNALDDALEQGNILIHALREAADLRLCKTIMEAIAA